MQHDHVLKNVYFDVLTPPGSGVGVGGGLREKYLLPYCCIHDYLYSPFGTLIRGLFFMFVESGCISTNIEFTVP